MTQGHLGSSVPEQSEPRAAHLLQNIFTLLKIIGEPGKCKKCGKEIFWVLNHKTGKRMPITLEALNHFADCPYANEFKKNHPLTT